MFLVSFFYQVKLTSGFQRLSPLNINKMKKHPEIAGKHRKTKRISVVLGSEYSVTMLHFTKIFCLLVDFVCLLYCCDKH